MARRVTVIEGKWRLKMDAHAIELEEYIEIDPTRAPNYDPSEHFAETRKEWRSAGKYYSTLERALEGLIELNIRRGDDTDLAQLLEESRQWRRKIEEAMQ